MKSGIWKSKTGRVGLVLILLMGCWFFNSIRSKPLSREEQQFVGTWQAIEGAPDTFHATFDSERWLVTLKSGQSADYRWQIQDGELILTEILSIPKNAGLGTRFVRFVEVVVARIRNMPIPQDEIIPMEFQFLSDDVIEIRARPSATYLVPVKVRLERVPCGGPAPRDNTP